MREGVVIGRSRILLMIGLLGIGLGLYLDIPKLYWGSTVVVALSFGINSYVKVKHYWGLQIQKSGRIFLVVSWLLLSVLVIGVFVDYLYAWQNSEYEGFFWAFVGGSIGLALFHRRAQTIYLSDIEKE